MPVLTYENHPKSEYRRGARATPGYGRLIVELTRCSEDEAGGIERLLRDRFGTLDGLSRAEFRREAKRAQKILVDLWKEVWPTC